MRLTTALASLASCLPAPATPVQQHPAAASVERIETIASDGALGDDGRISNGWGGHQPRITRHADGTVRIVYLRRDANGRTAWRLMKRPPTGGWAQEAAGATAAEVSLLREPTTDAAIVVAWPGSVPTVHVSPSFSGSVVPGTWQTLPNQAHNYSGIGIGSDGTLCMKVHYDRNIKGKYTVDTETQYVCGRRKDGAWSWHPQVKQYIGLRHAYDYILPGAFGDAPPSSASACVTFTKKSPDCRTCRATMYSTVCANTRPASPAPRRGSRPTS